MNRYPLWKYVLIAIAIVVGIVYTLPNFFPEVPAVQVSSSKASAKSTPPPGTVEEALRPLDPYRGAGSIPSASRSA
jgi:preprotein translocase subunit SecD